MKKHTKDAKDLLKRRVSVVCDCKSKKSQLKDRSKYGVSRCDTFSMDNSLALIMSNALFSYVAVARENIMERDEYWETIIKHAEAIKEYADIDFYDSFGKKEVKAEYRRKVKAWKEAMNWLRDNWGSLWW